MRAKTPPMTTMDGNGRRRSGSKATSCSSTRTMTVLALRPRVLRGLKLTPTTMTMRTTASQRPRAVELRARNRCPSRLRRTCEALPSPRLQPHRLLRLVFCRIHGRRSLLRSAPWAVLPRASTRTARFRSVRVSARLTAQRVPHSTTSPYRT